MLTKSYVFGLAVLTITCAPLACSPASDGAAGPGGGSGGGAGAPAATGGADTSGTGGADGSGKTGTIAFFEFYPTARIAATISDGSRSSDCTRTEHGVCTVTTCPEGSSGETLTWPHAGTISYESDERGIVRIAPAESGGYLALAEDLREGEERSYLGEEEAYFRATGGDVPAFEQRLDFPILPLLDAPVTEFGNYTAPRDQDLELAWSRGVTDMFIWIQSSAPAGSSTLFCRIDATLGAATIPSAALSALPSGASLNLWGLASAQLQAGDYALTLLSGSYMRTPDRAYQIRMSVE